MSQAPPQVFVSSSSHDAKFAAQLARGLEKLGVNVSSDRGIQHGETWADEIKTALARADVILLLISASFLASPFSNIEAGMASSLGDHSHRQVVPILLRGVTAEDLPGLLRAFSSIDASDMKAESILTRLKPILSRHVGVATS